MTFYIYLLIIFNLCLCYLEISDILSAFEYIDSSSINAIRQNNPGILLKIQDSILPSNDNEILLLIECLGFNKVL
jgi:hypothetical protein